MAFSKFFHDSRHPDEIRMTLGEHLDELRVRLVRALIGLAVGTIVCYWFIDYIVAFLTWPVFSIYKNQGFPAELKTFSPSEGFMTDLKVAIIVGLIVSAPYSLTQVWGFVAAGLYPHERKWVRAFVPVSIALFFTGALFLIVVVSPVLLQFLLTYRTTLPDIEKYMPSALVRAGEGPQLLETPVATTWPAPAGSQPAPILAFVEDPPDAPSGVIWVNTRERELRLREGSKVYAVGSLREVGLGNRVVPDMRISELIPFVLQMAAAFGIGFQVPVVVAFLALVGICSAAQMGAARRYIILGMAVVAAVVTPPDPFSMMMLLGPMVLLFEGGLLAARIIERRRKAAEASE